MYILAFFLRIFELESKVSGACVDFVNIYDGISTASSTINTSPLCGVIYRTTYLSTSNAMTVYFETDKTGARHGFDYVFVAVTTGTCNSGQFACNTTGVCIPEDLHCSTQDECADNSDETGCVYDFPDGVELDPNAALIIGLCVGLLVALVVVSLFGYYCYRHHIRWRFFMRRPLTVDEVVHEETTHFNAYPVTKVYYKERFQDMYIDAKGPPVYNGAVATHITKRDSATASQVSSDVISAEDLSTSTRKDSIYA
ncbi:hypothetical protein DPMN_177811 [Dreissena polymorpha]|uniref:CUB domain-containing protein n=1 Tax=Dreissena polymorpha TaxID=45954 RepID=A0A9D4IM00_DREPO|nr:hypothetical protein DPMN_177811 [Dreissena polymorpha]